MAGDPLQGMLKLCVGTGGWAGGQLSFGEIISFQVLGVGCWKKRVVPDAKEKWRCDTTV